MAVGVGVLVNVKVGVKVRVTVNVGEAGLMVGVGVGVLVGVNVGLQHNTSASTQFDLTGVDPAFIEPWFDIVELQVFAVPHHVKEPDASETEPIKQFTFPALCVHPPNWPP